MQSRVQMQLFKARQMASKEFEDALARKGLTLEEAQLQMRLRGWNRATCYPKVPGIAGTSARFVTQLWGGPVSKALSGFARWMSPQRKVTTEPVQG
jgi:hypothetical protein